MLSHWKVTHKISTSLQLGINPVGENRSQLPLLFIVSSLHLFQLQAIPFTLLVLASVGYTVSILTHENVIAGNCFELGKHEKS